MKKKEFLFFFLFTLISKRKIVCLTLVHANLVFAVFLLICNFYFLFIFKLVMKHFNLNLCLFYQYINMDQVFLEFVRSISRTLVLLLLLDCLCISALNLLIYLDFMFFICFCFHT